jgi:AIG2 family protein
LFIESFVGKIAYDPGKQPMSDTFLYFAYGSNMLTRRLKARTSSAITVGIAFVEGRRLTFDKASSDGSGKCHIEPTDNSTDRVHGVLFRIAVLEEDYLDAAEGFGKGYDKDRSMKVVTPYCTLQAVAYFATHRDSAHLPYHWYKALVVAGAVEHGLPKPYIEWLRTTVSQPDPDAKRRAENEALLFET